MQIVVVHSFPPCLCCTREVLCVFTLPIWSMLCDQLNANDAYMVKALLSPDVTKSPSEMKHSAFAFARSG